MARKEIYSANSAAEELLLIHDVITLPELVWLSLVASGLCAEKCSEGRSGGCGARSAENTSPVRCQSAKTGNEGTDTHKHTHSSNCYNENIKDLWWIRSPFNSFYFCQINPTSHFHTFISCFPNGSLNLIAGTKFVVSLCTFLRDLEQMRTLWWRFLPPEPTSRSWTWRKPTRKVCANSNTSWNS